MLLDLELEVAMLVVFVIVVATGRVPPSTPFALSVVLDQSVSRHNCNESSVCTSSFAMEYHPHN